jgi:hypothetical protein
MTIYNERLAGYPQMPAFLLNDLCTLLFDLLPGLYAFNHMNNLCLLPVRTKAVLYVVCLFEVLPSVAPCTGVPILGLKLAYGFKFALYAR